MKKAIYASLLAAIISVAFLAGFRYSRTASDTGGSETGRRILYYVDPMNPANISDKPGTAPCGMPLEPIYADDGPPGAAPPPGAVKVSTEKQQLIGVRSEPVEAAAQTRVIRTLGRVAPDENRVYPVLSVGQGWVWDVKGSTTGEFVQKDQVLATFYNKGFFGAEQALFFGLDFIESTREKLGERSELPKDPARIADAGLADFTARDKPAEVYIPPAPRIALAQTAHAGAREAEAPEDAPVADDAGKTDGGAEEIYDNINMQGWTTSEQLHSPYTPRGNADAGRQIGSEPSTQRQQSESKYGPTDKNIYNKYLIDQARTATDNLMDLGMSETQIKEISRTREWTTQIEIRSPTAGFVISRKIAPGQRFTPDTEFFRIADLTRVWIVADVFEREAQHIQKGGKAEITLPHSGRKAEAEVAEVLPVFDPSTRTLKVRLEVDNPGFELKPDMFVDVEFQVSAPRTVSVPAEAIVNTGTLKRVYIDAGNGIFEQRPVRTGRNFGEHVEILEGVALGERIVVSGNFLLDSETRMKTAAANRARMVSVKSGTAKDPVCGMRVDPTDARSSGLTADFDGRTYYFCTPECKIQFEKGMKKHQPGSSGSTPAEGPNSGHSGHGKHSGHKSAQSETRVNDCGF